MILGRSTPQWLGLITSAGSLAQLLIVQLVPDLDPVIVATIIGAVGTFLGAFIAFLANTATTPVSDPILPAGTSVKVEGTQDTVVVQPTPPGPAGVEGGAAG
jgi:hypothetical protein